MQVKKACCQKVCGASAGGENGRRNLIQVCSRIGDPCQATSYASARSRGIKLRSWGTKDSGGYRDHPMRISSVSKNPNRPGSMSVRPAFVVSLTHDLAARTGPASDILGPKLRMLLVAINPSPRSAEERLPFASPTNAFWKLLYISGLISIPLGPKDAFRLPDFGIGLTSLSNRPTRLAEEVSPRERHLGAGRVLKIATRIGPEVVVLLGPTLAPLFLEPFERVGVGWKQGRVGPSRVYVLPNPSGRNRAYPGFSAKLRWYRALALAIGLPKTRSRTHSSHPNAR